MIGTCKDLAARGAIVFAGLAALTAGLLVGATACCSNTEPIVNGTFEIIDAEREELLGATVEIRDDVVEISFTDLEGTDWVVRYAIEFR